MKINGTDIAAYFAKQHTVAFTHYSPKGVSEWAGGGILPFLLGPQMGMKQLQIALIVKGEDRESILHNSSGILGLCRGEMDIELDGFSTKFKGTLSKITDQETSRNRWHKLTLTVEGYEYGPVVHGRSANADAVTIYNPGTMGSPIRVEVTMSEPNSTAELDINGTKVATLNNPSDSTSMVVIDALTGEISTDGSVSMGNLEIYELPTAPPGWVTIAAEKCAVSADITPLYI